MVPDPAPLHIAGGEQEPRRFQASRRQDVAAGAHAEGVPRDGRHGQMRGRAPVLVKLDPGAVGVQDEADASGTLQGRQVALAEIGGHAPPLELARDDVLAIETLDHLCPAGGESVIGFVSKRPGLAELVRPGVERIEVGLRYWPAAVRHVIAPLEIDCVQRNAASTPDGRGSAEDPPAKEVQRVVLVAVRNLSTVEVLGRTLETAASAFEKHHVDVGQAERDRDAGGPGPYDAHPALDCSVARHIRGIEQHVAVLWPAFSAGLLRSNARGRRDRAGAGVPSRLGCSL